MFAEFTLITVTAGNSRDIARLVTFFRNVILGSTSLGDVNDSVELLLSDLPAVAAGSGRWFLRTILREMSH